MARIEKRGNTWQYTVSRYVDKKYKPIRKGGFLKEKDAKTAAAKVELDLAEGRLPVSSEDVFSVYFKHWMTDYKMQRSPQTIDRYSNTLMTVEMYFPNETLQSMTKRKYQRVMDDYGITHALSTMKKLNTHIRACVKEAIDEGRIRVDFTRGVELNSKIPEKNEADKFLSFTDSRKLLNELKQHWKRSPVYVILILALTSGMRFGELLGLKRTDFDFKNNQIHVNQAWDYKKKTGFIPLKNAQSKRSVDMNQSIMDFFKEYFEATPKNIKGLAFYNNLSADGSFTNNGVNKTLKKTLDRLELKTITCHSLRHTFISILLYKRISIHYVAEQAGHKNSLITQTTYAHVLDEMRDEEKTKSAEVIGELFKDVV